MPSLILARASVDRSSRSLARASMRRSSPSPSARLRCLLRLPSPAAAGSRPLLHCAARGGGSTVAAAAGMKQPLGRPPRLSSSVFAPGRGGPSARLRRLPSPAGAWPQPRLHFDPRGGGSRVAATAGSKQPLVRPSRLSSSVFAPGCGGPRRVQSGSNRICVFLQLLMVSGVHPRTLNNEPMCGIFLMETKGLQQVVDGQVCMILYHSAAYLAGPDLWSRKSHEKVPGNQQLHHCMTLLPGVSSLFPHLPRDSVLKRLFFISLTSWHASCLLVEETMKTQKI